MQAQLESQEFEEQLETWERSERAALHTFRDLSEYPRFERLQEFPSCKIPCYHFLPRNQIDGVHATYTKGDRIPQLLNTLYDLSINQCHNQAIIYDRLLLLARYEVRRRPLQAIPEESVLRPTEVGGKTIQDLYAEVQTLRADLREVKQSQVGLRISLSEIREVVQSINSRESDPKPIEAETARVAEQLKKRVTEVQRALKELKEVAKSLIPET